MAMENPTIELSHQNHNLVRDFPSSHSWSVYIPLHSSISHYNIHLYSLLHPFKIYIHPIQVPFNHHFPWSNRPISPYGLPGRSWARHVGLGADRPATQQWDGGEATEAHGGGREAGESFLALKRKGSREKYMVLDVLGVVVFFLDF